MLESASLVGVVEFEPRGEFPGGLVVRIFFFLIYLFIYFWLRWVFVAACRLFSSCGEWGLLFIVVHGLLIEVASLVAERGLYVCGLQ